MTKKNDKIIILFVILFIGAVLSWFIPGGGYNSGVFESSGIIRAGLYDLFLIIYSALYYKVVDVFFIIVIGGCYGVLSKTNSYRLIVDKCAKLVKKNEVLSFLVITLVTSLLAAISSNIVALFCLVPFIYTIFLKNGNDKLTAISASFGGMFVGYIGMLVGTFGLNYLNEATEIAYNAWILPKLFVFIFTYALFALFTILHMKKVNNVDMEKYDLFCTEELDESNVKAYKKTKTLPSIICMVLLVIVLVIGLINWSDSFGISFFNELNSKFTNGFAVGGVPVLSSLLGKYFPALGAWEDLIVVAFLFVLMTFVISMMNNVKISDLLRNFEIGSRKVLKVATFYMLTFTMVFISSTYPWTTTVVNKILSSGSFNIIIILFAAFVSMVLMADPDFVGYTFGSYIASAFASNLTAAVVLWHVGSGLALVIAPTSFVLMMALSYADVSYVDWIKYIWKFFLSTLIAVLLVFLIVCVI